MAGMIGVLVALLASFWVFFDAREQGIKKAPLYAILTFLFLIIGLPAYLFARYRHSHRPGSPSEQELGQVAQQTSSSVNQAAGTGRKTSRFFFYAIVAVIGIFIIYSVVNKTQKGHVIPTRDFGQQSSAPTAAFKAAAIAPQNSDQQTTTAQINTGNSDNEGQTVSQEYPDAINANKLIRTYKRNSLRFYNEYDRQHVTVYGVVDDIKASSDGGAKVIIGNPDGMFNKILCKVGPSEVSEAEQLSKRSEVVASGVIRKRHGIYLFNIELSNCKLKGYSNGNS